MPDQPPRESSGRLTLRGGLPVYAFAPLKLRRAGSSAREADHEIVNSGLKPKNLLPAGDPALKHGVACAGKSWLVMHPSLP